MNNKFDFSFERKKKSTANSGKYVPKNKQLSQNQQNMVEYVKKLLKIYKTCKILAKYAELSYAMKRGRSFGYTLKRAIEKNTFFRINPRRSNIKVFGNVSLFR